jgi:hypothetical protein
MISLTKFVKDGLADVSLSMLSLRKPDEAGSELIEMTEVDERVVTKPGPVGS